MEGQQLRAIPGEGLRVPLWILGSSLYGAQLAAALGLPYAFASHFAPDDMVRALEIYRATFEPSEQLDKPHAMLTVNVFAADTDAEATRHFTSLQQAFLNLRRGRPGQVPPPIDDIEGFWSPGEKAGVEHALACSFVGAADTVERGLREFLRTHTTRRADDRRPFLRSRCAAEIAGDHRGRARSAQRERLNASRTMGIQPRLS